VPGHTSLHGHRGCWDASWAAIPWHHVDKPLLCRLGRGRGGGSVTEYGRSPSLSRLSVVAAAVAGVLCAAANAGHDLPYLRATGSVSELILRPKSQSLAYTNYSPVVPAARCASTPWPASRRRYPHRQQPPSWPSRRASSHQQAPPAWRQALHVFGATGARAPPTVVIMVWRWLAPHTSGVPGRQAPEDFCTPT
jgi:hypothetical protein